MLEITGALTAARATLQIAEAALAARDDAKVRTALIELQSKLFDATSAALSMAEKATSLQAALSAAEREKAELEEKVRERGRYALQRLGSGAFAYASQGHDQPGAAPKHYLCQPCYDKGIKVVLRPVESGYGLTWYCSENNSHEFDRKTFD